MCTLTYLPTQKGFLLTSSRDESTAREPAVFPVFNQSKYGTLLMPLDPQGAGTWILATENGEAACLLNGAVVNHQRTPPYRKSRGRVIVESFDYPTIHDFLKEYDFDNIEPFTLIKVAYSSEKRVLHEILWDGHQLKHNLKDSKGPHMWSSVTLYNETMRAKREEWFKAWLNAGKAFTAQAIQNFHLYGGEGDPSVDFKMTRSGGLQTISLSCISMSQKRTQLQYLDLLTQQRSAESLKLKHKDNKDNLIAGV